MFHRRVAAAILIAAVGIPCVTARAAGCWPWPLGSTIALGYGASYTAPDGRRCTHGGVDIPAAAGTPVRACADGIVSFAGLVPAGAGSRSFAVSVLTDDGLTISYVPLDRPPVTAGARVSAGDTVGFLAAGGDASSDIPHLHLGVRRGDRRLDPSAFLCSAPGAPASPAADPTAVAPVVGPPSVPAPVPAAPARPGVPRPRAPVRVAVSGAVGSPVTGACTERGVSAPPSGARVSASPVPMPATGEGGAASSGSRSAQRSSAWLPISPLRVSDLVEAVAAASERAMAWLVRLLAAAAAIACILPVWRAASAGPRAAVARRVRA